ncbi:MAG: beta-galactosidase [Clostridiales bacterium]|nr:beta-galactosidase [Clostridiales bacterium]
MKQLLFGAAYYDEYMPYDRLEEDVAMMKKANINTVRIAESTWSTCEPQEGVFDFSHVERVIDAMEKADINVIIGTPTYAVPTWMVKSHPDVLATTVNGRGIYGPRQIMDITNPVYLYYSERVIRQLMKHTAHRKNVIGFQLDNETKYYGTAGKNVQEKFVKYLRKKFNDDLDALNAEFGLDYWSNRINAWEDFPDVRGTINGSLGAAFEKFQRSLVTAFLSWQSSIVSEYKRDDQFITHNLDFDWKGYSYGVQPQVDHYHVAQCLTIAGADIYHPTQDKLTGAEIAFGGDMIRSLKKDNYLVIETEAQGFPAWTPYQGQLRLQAYSHIASGANSVMYWHWHSIHNACETYWKGILSHDFAENAVYKEACVIGGEFKRIGSHLVNLKKKNDVAIMVSNEALTALKWFPIEVSAGENGDTSYNDVVRWIYDTLYTMNVECDFIWPESENLNRYKMIIVPALYAASDQVLLKLKDYVAGGGYLAATFKTGFANENVKVAHDVQPHLLRQCFGVRYHQFTFPKNVKLTGKIAEIAACHSDSCICTENVANKGISDFSAKVFMELLIPETAKVLLKYDHYNWGEYAAVTENQYKQGMAYYIGCMTDKKLLCKIFKHILDKAEIHYEKTGSDRVILRKGINDFGKNVYFYMNYSPEQRTVAYTKSEGKDLISGANIVEKENIVIEPWNLRIIESCQ